MPRVDNTQELDEILGRLMQYSYDYGSGNIPTSENPPLLIARQAKQAITSLIKELVEEAKPSYKPISKYAASIYNQGFNQAVEEYEQNVLKALEEV